MGQKPALGKGLASLFPGVAPSAPVLSQPIPATSATPTSMSHGAGAVAAGAPTLSADLGNRDRHPGISLASVDEIRVNQYQPRRDFDDQALEELAQSIRANGIIQPLVVRKGPQGEYQLIAGERRLRAAKLAGIRQVPIVIRKSTDREALEIALVENIQRQNLNCIDEALAYFQLMQDFTLTQEEVAQRVGKDRATVANHLRLLRLPEAIIDDLKRQILSFGHGKALLGIEDNEARLRVRAEVVEKRLSVRDTEALVDRLKKAAAESAATGQNLPETKEVSALQSRLATLSQDLGRQFSTKVEVKGSDRKGKITFHYATRLELDRIIEALQNR